jgi:VanZ family protein
MHSLFRRCLRNPQLWQLALACYWSALFIGTHVPIDRIPLHQGSADKVAHLAAFAGLAMIFATTWQLSAGRLMTRHLVWAWVVIAFYGAVEEITQPLVGRVASIWDWFADGTGAAIGLAVFYFGSGRWLGNTIDSIEIENGANRPRAWHRFSLKALFVLTTFAAAVCYWMMLPTINAQRFVRALHEREYGKAEHLFVSWSDKFPGDFKQHDIFEIDPRIQPLTWSELWQGERRILVTARYGNKKGAATSCGATIFAYRRGLALHPLVLPLPFRS